MSALQYIREAYGVPAEIGRRVIVGDRSGIIAADRGNYIGVNFDDQKPGAISNCHPTCEVIYEGMGAIRKMKRSQKNYRDYLDVADCYDGFLHFLQRRALERKESA